MTLAIDLNKRKFTNFNIKITILRVFVLTNKTFKFKRNKIIKFTLMGALI